LIAKLRGEPPGARTVVLYTADHGEAFREHGQLGHTTSLFDEEIHVPAWIDAPPGSLTESERDAVRAAKREPVWHLDFAPTILDLLGLADAPALASFRARMVGSSLLRMTRTSAVLPLTNCTDTWGCGVRNWGAMQRTLKLEAREFDTNWHCYDLALDPDERRDIGADACPDLRRVAEVTFGRLPRDSPEMRGLGP
jgi:arylsulfatase A-like enzyme